MPQPLQHPPASKAAPRTPHPSAAGGRLGRPGGNPPNQAPAPEPVDPNPPPRKEGAQGGTRGSPVRAERSEGEKGKPPAAAPGVFLSGEKSTYSQRAWEATTRRLLALRPSQRLRAFRRHIWRAPLQRQPGV